MNDAKAVLKSATDWAAASVRAFQAEHPHAVEKLEAHLAQGGLVFELRITDLLGEHPVLQLIARSGAGYETPFISQRLDRADAGKPN